ncbi:MAG: 3'-5' exonuclease, partial [Clostridia bacterium]|nr:3'-5' exonuclease [Clostridia bacterium]
FLSIYGYQTINSSKSQFFFFLDKSRTKKSDQGKIIYPAIKVSSKVVDKFPNLNTEEAKKYIATSYKLYNPESYDDLIHYRIGKHIYYKQQSEIIDDYCVIDIETTGLNEKYDQIIEIAAIRVRDNKITDTFTSLIKPSITIPIDSTAINGITNEMVKNAPTIKEILPKFVEFIGKDTVIGHYVSFDLKFIDRYCIRELGKSFTNKSLDTCHLSRKIFSELKNYKLSTLCHELNITQSNHRADIDCISTKELYDKIKERMLKSI